MAAPTSWLTFLHLFASCFTAADQLHFEQLVTLPPHLRFRMVADSASAATH